MRRGRDRVRGGAASNAVFGFDRLASWRADGVTLHSVLEAGRRGIVAVFSPRKRRMLLLKLIFGHGKGSYCFGSLRKVTRWRHATLRTEGDLLVMHRGRVRRLTCPATRKPSKSPEQQLLANRA